MECKQYDDIIFLELPDDKQEEYRKCFTDELGYESLIIDINFFDIYTMKRRSASYKTEYNFEDIFLKSAAIVFSKTEKTPAMTPLEVDSSKMLTTPFARALPTAYIQIKTPISSYEEVFFKCRDNVDGNMTLEEYLKELEKIIKIYEAAISQKLSACKDLLYAIKEQEKDKLQLPYNIADLKRDYEMAQNAYNEDGGKYKNILNTKKQVDTEYVYVIDDKVRLEGELKEAVALLRSLGVKVESADKVKYKPKRFADEKFGKKKKRQSKKRHRKKAAANDDAPTEGGGNDDEEESDDKEGSDDEEEDEDDDEEDNNEDGDGESAPKQNDAVQNKDPEVEKEMSQPASSQTGVMGAIRSAISGTWYVLKVAWYGIKTINYGVRRTWAIACDIKGFLDDKPAQIQLATLLYNELKSKIKEINSEVKTVTGLHNAAQKEYDDSEKQGLNQSTVDTLQKNVDIMFERVRRFEYVRESIVGPKMTTILEDNYNNIMSALNLQSKKELDYVNILAQFPIKFSMENFLRENSSSTLSEEEIGMDSDELLNTAKAQAENLYRRPTVNHIPKMRRQIQVTISSDPMEAVTDCTNQFIIPTFDDYIKAYNIAQVQKWSGLIC